MSSSLRSCLRAFTRLFPIVCVVTLALVVARSAGAAPGLLVGATEDMFKLEPGLARSLAGDLGLGAARVSLHWDAGQTTLHGSDAAELDNAVSTGVRVIVAVYGWRDTAPQDDASREAYCSYVRGVLQRYPQIQDVVVWNEPNISYFWRPQFDATGASVAPAAYGALLARCWDMLHALRPTVNVIAPATSPWGTDDPLHEEVVSHSPTSFIRELGAAYRASGRVQPIFDTVGHHAYGAFPGERPWRRHGTPRRISQGDLARLVEVLKESFSGTAQGVPGAPAGARTVPVWYMEAGFETSPDDAKRHLYVNAETTSSLPDSLGMPLWTPPAPDPDSAAPDQATQLRDAVRLAACQPHVTAFFNFLLRDQEELNYWQSGVLWADRTRKDSYAAFKEAVAEVARGAVDCAQFADAAVGPSVNDELLAMPPSGLRPPETTPLAGAVKTAATSARPVALAIRRLLWLRKRTFTADHADWSIAVRTTRAARYRAVIERKGRSILVARGSVAGARLTTIRFPRRTLRPGAYRVVLQLVSAPPGPQALRARSAPFRVLPRPRGASQTRG